MNEEQRENLSRLVKELDEAIPYDGAVVEMTVYGGAPDESWMVGTEAGYLRLGIELLKGTLQARQDTETGKRFLVIDLEYLEADNSDIYFHEFSIDETLRKESVVPGFSLRRAVKDKILEVMMVVFGLLLFGTFITGVVTIVRGIFGLFR